MTFSKRMLSFFISLLLIISIVSISTSAVTFSDGVFYYTLDETTKTATITDYISKSTEVVIPDSYYEYDVVAINQKAFIGNTGIVSVSFSSTTKVKTIGERAFANCTSLGSVQIPSSLTTIGSGAFAGCTALTTVNVTSSNLTVGENAFYDCSSLETFKTESVSSFGDNAFLNTGLSKVVITDDVSEVPSYCFAYCEKLTNVIIKDPATVINPTAFYKETNDIVLFADNNALALEFAKANGITGYALGDVDLNGSVKIRDATHIQLKVAKLLELDDIQCVCADVSGDGKVSVRDASMIQTYIAKFITEF